MLVYWLDIIGTAVFAISGVLLAGKLRMDPFGVLVLGVRTADGSAVFRLWVREEEREVTVAL